MGPVFRTPRQDPGFASLDFDLLKIRMLNPLEQDPDGARIKPPFYARAI